MTQAVLKAANWIGGNRDTAGSTRESIDPATSEVIGRYPDNGLPAAKAAVAAANAAFRDTQWVVDHELRARVLRQMADAFERNRQRLMDVLMLENGKVAFEAASRSTWCRASCAMPLLRR